MFELPTKIDVLSQPPFTGLERFLPLSKQRRVQENHGKRCDITEGGFWELFLAAQTFWRGKQKGWRLDGILKNIPYFSNALIWMDNILSIKTEHLWRFFFNEYNKCLLLYFHAINVFLPELLLGFCGLLINYSRCLTDECNKLRKQSANNTVMETTWSGCSEQFQQWGVGGRCSEKISLDCETLRNLRAICLNVSRKMLEALIQKSSDMLHNFSCVMAIYDVNMNFSLPGAARCPKQN